MNLGEFLPTIAPLADRSHWERLGDKFSGNHLRVQPEDLYGLVGLGLVFVALLVALRWAGWLQRVAQGRDARRRLYRDLCAAHGLNWRDRQLMHKAQKELGLEAPEKFFVRPDLFENAAPVPKAAEDEAAWRELGERLFATEA